MTSQSHPLKRPTTFRIGDVIIAAGQSGHPVSVFWNGYPPAALTAVWRYLAEIAGPDRVLHVHGRTEVRKLEKDAANYRLVLLHNPKQYPSVAWAIDAARFANDACPSVLYRMRMDNQDAAPLPHLLLEGTPDEVGEIMDFIASSRQRITKAIQPKPVAPMAETFAQAPSQFSRLNVAEWNERRVLFSLLRGTCLLRHWVRGATGGTKIERADADYLLRLLDARGVHTSLRQAVYEPLLR